MSKVFRRARGLEERRRQSAWSLAGVLLASGLMGGAPASARESEKVRTVDARTGLIVQALGTLAAAERKGDPAEITRVAERVGWSRLLAAATGRDKADALVALAALPLLPGSVRGLGPVTPLLGVLDPALSGAAAHALGGMLAGVSPASTDEWDVAPDVVTSACAGLHTLALRPEAPEEPRLAAVSGLGGASSVCGAWLDLGALLADPNPALRRAAALVTHPVDRLAASGSAGVHDADRGVAAAATAALCRAGATPRAGVRANAKDPTWSQAREAARRLLKEPDVAPEDAVDMTSCLDPGTNDDRALLATLAKSKSPAVKDRAKELLEKPGQP